MNRLLALLIACLGAWGILAVTGVSHAADAYKGQPLETQWEYSLDGGKTFSTTPPTIEPTRTPEDRFNVVARCKFTIDDPAKIGLLKLMTTGDDGGLSLSNAEEIDRYNCGSKPVLTKSRFELNGQATDAGLAPYTLYRYVGIDPKKLEKGENTLKVSGTFWFQLAAALPGSLRLETLPADKVEFDRPPVLGVIGEDFFSLTARSVIPADFTVTVTPLEPAGAEQKHTFPRGTQLKARMPLPKGTHKFRYTLTGTASGASKQLGPFEVTVPTFGEGFRFAAAGGMFAYKAQTEPMVKFVAKLKEAKPQMLIATGGYQNCPNWDFSWNDVFFRDMGETLSQLPLMPMVGGLEMMSPVAFSRQFYFPPSDENFGRWTHVMGPIRFVSVDTFSMMDEKNGETLKWLDETLASAKEPYLIVLNAHITHGSGKNTSRMYRPGLAYVAKNVDPLLVKHKVTAAIGSCHNSYERLEPPAGEGVPSIMSCRTSSMGKPFHAGYATENKSSKASSGGDHFCIFELKKDKLELKTYDLDGKQIDTAEFAPRK
ncbi:MAG: hypothetical protein K8T91_28400 [Planctomycetes bacterium]|nr:hypothetical protein [Planctomycetota bacterium]